jgi:hypothetical protein
MPVNCVNAIIAPAQRQAVREAVSVIYQYLTCPTDLKSKERQDKAKFGEKNRSFVTQVAAIAEQNPDLQPHSVRLDDTKADVWVNEYFVPLISAAINLLGQREDTYFAATRCTDRP